MASPFKNLVLVLLLCCWLSSIHVLANYQKIKNEVLNLHYKIKDVEAQFSEDFQAPTIAIIGLQSSGKTSLVEAYLGFKAGFVSAKTGTRCPVRYALHSSQAHKEPKILVTYAKWKHAPSKELKSPQELPVIMEEIMTDLSDDEYSDTIVDVEVWFAGSEEIIFLDLPGFISDDEQSENRQEKAKKIEKVTLQYARDPKYFLVVVLKATEDPETLMDISIINSLLTGPRNTNMPPRNDWKQNALLIVNKLNLFFSGSRTFPTMDSANSYFRESSKYLPNRHYAILVPDAHDRTPSSFKSLEETEEAAWDAWKENLAKGTPTTKWDLKNDDFIGLSKAKMKIARLYLDSFQKALPNMIRRGQVKLRRAQDDATTAKKAAELTDVHKLRALYLEYILDYSREIVAVLRGTPRRGRDFKDWTSHKDNTRFAPAQLGFTYEEQLERAAEFNAHATPEWSACLAPDELKSPEHFGDQPSLRLLSALDKRYIGDAAYKRLRELFAYMLLVADGPEYTDEDIDTIAAADHHNQFDTPKVVITLVNDKMRRAGEGIEWYLYQVRFLFGHITSIAREFLVSGRFSALKDHLHFLDRVDQVYAEYIESKIKRLREAWMEDIEIFGQYLYVDVSVRNLIGLLSQPIENTLARPKDSHPAPLRVDPTQSYDRGAFLGSDEREAYQIATRVDEQYQTLGSLRETLLSKRKLFNLAEYVSGGFQMILAQDVGHVDYPLLRSIIQEYYFAKMEPLIWNLDSRSHVILQANISEANLGNELEKTLSRSLLSLSDDDLMAASGLDVETLSKEAATAAAKAEALQKTLRDIRVAEGKLQQLVRETGELNPPKPVTRAKKSVSKKQPPNAPSDINVVDVREVKNLPVNKKEPKRVVEAEVDSPASPWKNLFGTA